MKILTKNYELYTYDELSSDAKEKALEDYRNGNEYYFLSEDLEYKLQELLKDNKITSDDAKVYYSLSWNQGDGAMFEGTCFWKSYVIKIKQSGYYYHYNSKTYTITSVKTDKEASDAVYQDFEKIYLDICGKLEASGYAYIKYEDSEEAFKESAECNEWTFLSSGVMMNS